MSRGNQTPADFGFSGACHDPAIIFENLFFHDPELSCQHLKAYPHIDWHTIVGRIGNHIQELINPISADRCDDAKLSKMRSQCIR
ncbi:hypothetical protein [Sphingobium chungbukense]|uniref:hypothetical protein n=1 Tax=Sphingobium chungbukense TaxID=56193 RepID=UPI00069BBC9E